MSLRVRALGRGSSGRPDLGEVREFAGPSGDLRLLRDPDGEPTPRQVMALWRLGLLVVALDEDDRARFTKAQAAWLIDRARRVEVAA